MRERRPSDWRRDLAGRDAEVAVVRPGDLRREVSARGPVVVFDPGPLRRRLAVFARGASGASVGGAEEATA